MPSKIVKSLFVEDYIVQVPSLKNITKEYEDGKLVLFDNVVSDKHQVFLNDYVNSIDSKEMGIRKAKGPNLIAKIKDESHILYKFTKYPEELQNIIINIYQDVKRYVKICFPNYVIRDENWTWRLTKTDKEEMHLDSYSGQNNDYQNVRIFINLDKEPRIWRTSHDFKVFYDFYKLDENEKTKHPNEINSYLNKKICWQALQYHEFHFQQFAMWMVNSQMVSHQGYYGNKLAAYTFRIDQESMLDPRLNFVNQAKALMIDA